LSAQLLLDGSASSRSAIGRMALLVYESLVNEAAPRMIDEGIRGDLQQPSRERDRSRSCKLASAL
jgi:hypothetical protein